MSNSFKVRCVSVTQDGRHIHVRFAQPGAGHFALVFPETDKDQHEYSPGKEYVLSVNTAAHSFSLSENDEAAKPDPYRHEHPEEGTFPHIVTQETLDQNPDMAVQGVEVGDTIQVPVNGDLPDADYQAQAAEELTGFPEIEGLENVPLGDGKISADRKDDVPDTNVGETDDAMDDITQEDIDELRKDNQKMLADYTKSGMHTELKNQAGDAIDGETEVPTAIEPENPQS